MGRRAGSSFASYAGQAAFNGAHGRSTHFQVSCPVGIVGEKEKEKEHEHEHDYD